MEPSAVLKEDRAYGAGYRHSAVGITLYAVVLG